MNDRERARGYIREKFLETPYDVSAYDMYDFVVNRRGVAEKYYRLARKDMGIKSYRVGNHYHFTNPFKKDAPQPSLEDELEKALLPFVTGVEWTTFLAAVKVALKRVKKV